MEYWPYSYLVVVVPYGKVFYRVVFLRGFNPETHANINYVILDGKMSGRSSTSKDSYELVNVSTGRKIRANLDHYVDFQFTDKDVVEKPFLRIKENEETLNNFRKLAKQI